MKALLTYLKKGIVLILALQILNIGLFAQEFQTINVHNVEENIINSVTEYIAEVILEEENAFPEKQNTHTANSQKEHTITLKGIEFKMIDESYSFYGHIKVSTQHIHQTFVENPFSDYVADITPPPPKHQA